MASTILAATQTNPLENHHKYSLVNPLSSGSFGFVHLYRNIETGEQVAIKFIERGDRVNKYVEAEILNHRMLRHPHVIEFKEVFLTDTYICIAMEYATGGNLFSYVQRAVRLKEPAARWFFQQLVIGLDYCHRKGVVNRDIKLENTLLQMVQGLPLPLLKICDFGYSKAHFMSAPKSKVGTLAYMSPEVLNSKGTYAGNLADIWSCGVMLYVMLFGQYPFESPSQGPVQQNQRVSTMMARILQVQWTIPSDVPISAECRDLLSRMLVLDPTKRLTMQQITEHPWFRLNLPPDALAMNTNFLTNTDFSGVQTVPAIQALLHTAQTPAPGHYNFTSAQEDLTEVIDDIIEDELAAGPSIDHVRAPPGRPAGPPQELI
mmetsp:Transcript_18816/g.32119  ORF Transcript_18816/g.32119 Transcript_18816/m.32119 type:complete len:375 (-) Transcript_18816:784-1908(-)